MSSLEVRLPIVIDLAKNTYVEVNITEGSQNAYIMEIYLLNQGKEVFMDDIGVITLKAITPSGAIVFNDVKRPQGDCVEYKISDTIMSETGKTVCTMQFMNEEGVTIHSFEWYINVQSSLYDENRYVKQDDITAVRSYLLRAETAADKSEEHEKYLRESEENLSKLETEFKETKDELEDYLEEIQDKVNSGAFVGPSGIQGPQGKQGPQGEPGPQGIQGEQGKTGQSGITAPASGIFILYVEENGDVYAEYSGDIAPQFEMDASGDVYYVISDNQKVYIGNARGPKGEDGSDYVLTEEDKEEIRGKLIEEHNISEESHQDIREDIKYLEVYKANSILSIHTGEVIQTTDSANVPPKNIKLFGGSTQEANPSIESPKHIVSVGQKLLTGSNFFDAKTALASQIELGLCEVNDDGSVTIYPGWNGSNRSFVVPLKAGTYYFSEASTFFHQLTNGDTHWYGSVTFNEDTDVNCYCMGINANTVNGSVTIHPMITKEDGIPLEPFTDGQEVLVDNGKVDCKLLTNNLLNPTDYFLNDTGKNFPYTEENGFQWFYTGIWVNEGDVLYDGYSIDGVFTTNYTHYYNIGYISSSKGIIQTKDGKIVAHKSGMLNLRLDAPIGSVVDKPYLGYTPPSEYEPYTEQPFTVLTPDGFKGIGDVSDYVDFEKGVLVRHFAELIFDGSDDEEWIVSGSNVIIIPIDNTYQPELNDKYNLLCNQFMVGSWNEVANKYEYVCIEGGYFKLYNSALCDGTTALLKEHLKQNPLKLVYQLAEPIETDLTEEEMAQYNSLIMNKGNNILLNDAGAYMELEQVCDTQLHIEQNYIPKSEHEALKTRVSDIEQAIANL